MQHLCMFHSCERGPAFTGLIHACQTQEEGGDDVKSSWPLCPGLHTCYNGAYKALQACEGKRIAKSVPQFGLQAATRLHEAGIASNRRSALLR